VYNSNSLRLKPSIAVSALFVVPAIAAIFLVLTRDLSEYPSLAAILIIICCTGYLTRLIGLLKLKDSIVEITTTGQAFYLTEKQGAKNEVALLDNSIISPLFCLLSFSRINQTSISKYFFPKSTRHLLICRYNVENFDNYRRFRVIARFGRISQPSQINS